MPGSSILPVALHKGKLYFLFGKENPLEDSAPGFSDFGGGLEAGENEFETAIREGAEELTGFLGDGEQIRKYINSAGGPLIIKHGTPENPKQNYTVHVIPFNYDPMLPIYYNNNHRFLWNKMDQKTLSATKLFEKIEIAWFSEADLRSRMSEYRHFYQDVVKMIIQKLPQIRSYLKKRANKTRLTQRNAVSKRRSKTLKQRGG